MRFPCTRNPTILSTSYSPFFGFVVFDYVILFPKNTWVVAVFFAAFFGEDLGEVLGEAFGLAFAGFLFAWCDHHLKAENIYSWRRWALFFRRGFWFCSTFSFLFPVIIIKSFQFPTFLLVVALLEVVELPLPLRFQFRSPWILFRFFVL